MKAAALDDLALATHGVNNGQAIKASPVWSLVSGSDADRRAVLHQLAELDRYHGLPNGMFSCDEHFAGRNPSQGSELCTVVETMFSLEQSLAILGDPALGDRLEKIAFNALPGTFTDDMWAHQYNQEPNQVEVSLHSKPWTTDGPESNIYGLAPHFGCCTANFHQGWPKLTASLWMASASGGLTAAVYAPCEVQTTVRGTAVTLSEETSYPFRGSVRIRVSPASPLEFPLSLRIPAWAAGAALTVNGRPQPSPEPGTFAIIDRRWTNGDVVELELPMQPRTVTGINDSVSIERGPLVFSLRDRRRLAEAARPRQTLRLAGLPHHRLELRALPIHERRPLTDCGRGVTHLRHALLGGERSRPSLRQSPQAALLASRRRRRQPASAEPRRQRRTRGDPDAHPLRRRQAAHHLLSATQGLISTSRDPSGFVSARSSSRCEKLLVRNAFAQRPARSTAAL